MLFLGSLPARPGRKALLSGLTNPQPERKPCHPKGRSEAEDPDEVGVYKAGAEATPETRNLPTDCPEDPDYS